MHMFFALIEYTELRNYYLIVLVFDVKPTAAGTISANGGTRATDLQRGVEHYQFGASWHQVITAVGLHEASVHIVLRI